MRVKRRETGKNNFSRLFWAGHDTCYFFGKFGRIIYTEPYTYIRFVFFAKRIRRHFRTHWAAGLGVPLKM